MNLAPTDDQQAIKETFGDLFARESPPERVREAEAVGHDPALWRLLVELGAVGIAVPEEAGGAGAGLLELALVAEEMGHHVACVPLVEAAVAARVLASSEGKYARELLGRALDGGSLAVVAPRPAGGGVAELVPGGAVADVVIALDGDELVAVESEPPPGVPNIGFGALADRPLSGGGLVRTVLARGDEAAGAFERARGEWKAATAAALAGLTSRAVAIGVAYANERVQFGVPIGSFQAVQHVLADVATASEGAHLLAREAAWAADRRLDSWPRLAAMAFAHGASTARRASAASLHFHGGYGYTLEYDIQLYLRRATGLALALGDPELEWEAIGAMTVGA